MRLLLLAYATIVILLGWWPWHILLLALIAARNPRPSKTVKRTARAPWPPKQITTPSVRSATDLKFDVGRVAVQGAGSPPAPNLFSGAASHQSLVAAYGWPPAIQLKERMASCVITRLSPRRLSLISVSLFFTGSSCIAILMKSTAVATIRGKPASSIDQDFGVKCSKLLRKCRCSLCRSRTCQVGARTEGYFRQKRFNSVGKPANRSSGYGLLVLGANSARRAPICRLER